jgi:cytoskeleton protein RodZ
MTENLTNTTSAITLESTNSATSGTIGALTIGQQLQQARTARSLTQEDVAKQLFVSKQLINDLEGDNYLKIAAPVYARGYIASYARFVQISVDRLLKEFDLIIRKTKQQFLYNTEEATTQMINKNRKLTVAENYTKLWDAYGNIAMIGAFVIAVLILLIYGYHKLEASKSTPVSIQSIAAPAAQAAPAVAAGTQGATAGTDDLTATTTDATSAATASKSVTQQSAQTH